MKIIGLILYLVLHTTILFGQKSDLDRAILQAKNGEYEKAMDYFLKDFNHVSQLNDTVEIIRSSRMIGNIFMLLKDSTNCNKYYQISIDLSRKIRDEKSLFYSLLAISSMNVTNNKSEQALEACKEALEIVQTTNIASIKNDTSTIGNIYINIGAAFERLKNNSKAVENYLIGAFYYEKYSKPQYQMGKLYRNIGLCYEKDNNKEESLIYYEKSLRVSLELGFKSSIQSAVNGLYRWHKKFGEPETALEYLEKSVELKDSIINGRIISSIEEFHSKYQSDRLNKKIDILSVSNEKNNHRIKTSRTWIIWLIIILLLLVSIVLGLILRQRFILKSQELEFEKKRTKLQKRVLTAQMNPHFLFNSLNSIQRMYLEGNMNEANDYVANFGLLLRKVLTYSDLEQIALSKDIDLLKIYLELERNRIDADFQFHIDIAPEVDASFVKVPPLLVQPFIENAIWHGIVPLKKTGNINVHYALLHDYLICTITDNGIGYEKSLNNKKLDHISKGVSIVRERLAHLSDPISIHQIGESGTCVTIKIPFN